MESTFGPSKTIPGPQKIENKKNRIFFQNDRENLVREKNVRGNFVRENFVRENFVRENFVRAGIKSRAHPSNLGPQGIPEALPAAFGTLGWTFGPSKTMSEPLDDQRGVFWTSD